MLESVFVLILLVGIGLAIFAFWKRMAPVLALASVLFLVSGLLLLDASPSSGIEEDIGFKIRHIGDNNFDIDVNKLYRNAGNDTSLNLLGNLFLWGGVVGLMMSLGFMIDSRFRGREK